MLSKARLQYNHARGTFREGRFEEARNEFADIINHKKNSEPDFLPAHFMQALCDAILKNERSTLHETVVLLAKAQDETEYFRDDLVTLPDVFNHTGFVDGSIKDLLLAWQELGFKDLPLLEESKTQVKALYLAFMIYIYAERPEQALVQLQMIQSITGKIHRLEDDFEFTNKLTEHKAKKAEEAKTQEIANIMELQARLTIAQNVIAKRDVTIAERDKTIANLSARLAQSNYAAGSSAMFSAPSTAEPMQLTPAEPGRTGPAPGSCRMDVG